MAEKTGRNGDDERRSNFRLKLNGNVRYTQNSELRTQNIYLLR